MITVPTRIECILARSIWERFPFIVESFFLKNELSFFLNEFYIVFFRNIFEYSNQYEYQLPTISIRPIPY